MALLNEHCAYWPDGEESGTLLFSIIFPKKKKERESSAEVHATAFTSLLLFKRQKSHKTSVVGKTWIESLFSTLLYAWAEG